MATEVANSETLATQKDCLLAWPFNMMGLPELGLAELTCLHVACEGYIVGLFQDCVLCAVHAKRITVMVKDMVTRPI